MNPFFLMTLLFGGLAFFMATDAALVSFQLVPVFSGLRWLRVHFVTLGLLSETIFGFLPLVVAGYTKQAKPAVRWDIWLSLNAGLLVLLVGIPLVNAFMILVGGTLIFIATVLLLKQLADLRTNDATQPNYGRPFYLAGLSYLLLGIIVGTGLWLGWGDVLRIAVPIEVHIHANNWGFMALIFAGILIDLYPDFAQRPLASTKSIKPIFWLLTVGAFGLVLGPWLKSELFTVPGILMYLAGTFWLLAIIFKPLIGERRVWNAGMWHLLSAHVWILMPVLVAPLILLKVPGFPGAGVEQSAPQALIYGWVLQFGYAIIPFVLRRAFQPSQPAQLGGNWWSLITVHIGGIFLWLSIFIKNYQELLHGIAYTAWALSLIPFVVSLWHIIKPHVQKATLESEVDAVDIYST